MFVSVWVFCALMPGPRHEPPSPATNVPMERLFCRLVNALLLWELGYLFPLPLLISDIPIRTVVFVPLKSKRESSLALCLIPHTLLSPPLSLRSLIRRPVRFYQSFSRFFNLYPYESLCGSLTPPFPPSPLPPSLPHHRSMPLHHFVGLSIYASS